MLNIEIVVDVFQINQTLFCELPLPVSLVIDSLPEFDPALFDVTHITSTNLWSYFTLPSQTVVLSLLNSLKSQSPLDPVTLCLFHSISPYLIGLITDIINLSVITSVVPQSMKYSDIQLHY